MHTRLARLAVLSSWALSLAAVTSEPALRRPDEGGRGVGVAGASADSGRRRSLNEGGDGRGEENIAVREGVVFQTGGCPQLLSEEEALAIAKDDSIPGNIITLVSEGMGRAGNHFLILSSYFAMAYCCKTKVLTMPRYDDTFPSAFSEDGSQFETDKRFFDFSGVDTLPLEEHEGLSRNPLVCEPHVEVGGVDAFRLWNIPEELLSCMNRVYVRGCEAAYLEPLLGAESFSYCASSAATHDRRLSEAMGRQEVGGGTTLSLATADAGTGPPGSASSRAQQFDPLRGNREHYGPQDARVVDTVTGEGGSSERSNTGMPSRDGQAAAGHEDAPEGRRRLGAAGEWGGQSSAGRSPRLDMSPLDDGHHLDIGASGPTVNRGSAGSLVIHIRSGDIFRALEPGQRPSRGFLSYGQPPLQFYLRAIASQPWSDVTILTFCPTPEQLNPTFAALEMMQQAGMLGPNVVTHKDRDLLTDIRAMLCADGLAISRSTLHFLTFAHTRAKHLFVPSACGPGTYSRGHREEQDVRKKKPNPNNTTLLCLENPETEVYGVDWKVDEAAYYVYDNWDSSPRQRLEMVVFDGVNRLSHCCAG